MKVRLSAPGKTFLLGEYAVLGGSPALLVSTGPRFSVELELGQSGSCEGIHPNSPAGRWVRQQNLLFQNASVRFVDPHGGKGGLGGSSAQFLGVYTWSILAETPMTEWPSALNPQKLWQAFRSVAWDGQGLPPSGADVMAQFMGGITQFQSQPFNLQSPRWPFADLSFSLFRTNKKVATHHHLGSMQGTHFGELKPDLDRALAAFHHGNAQVFIASLQSYGRQLMDMGLVDDEVIPLVEKLRVVPEVQAVKGCGALGADILLALHHPADKGAVVSAAEKLGLAYEASVGDLDQGLKLEVETASIPVAGSRYQGAVFSRDEGDHL
ncbi:MAG: hypothetical protein KDD68_20645 [Bdellovibrionales bacterium]|nr:hypothetical protein [Bdellovibrionales bacterium]